MSGFAADPIVSRPANDVDLFDKIPFEVVKVVREGEQAFHLRS